MIYTAQSGSRPAEIYRGVASGGQPLALTHLNDALFNEFAAANFEEVSYDSADGTRASGFEVKPPNFDFDRKYPLLLLIHGGPQGAWGENWSYRWNAQVFAAAGFVVFMPNPRGSTGYGQQFTDAVSKDCGGMPYEDIMAGVDQFAQRSYVDPNRMVAAGASYGGYMINWILGHSERFKALVSHAGVYDLRSEFGATEELWFPLWEFGGAPWETPDVYERWSPSNYVANFKTPTLVVHGQKDYRVPVTQGMQLYTALQMKKVPSKFLYFPDEGHWISKPRNSVFWYQNVIGWLAERAGLPASGITSSEPPTAPVISGGSAPTPASAPAPAAQPAASNGIRILGGEAQPPGQQDEPQGKGEASQP
jgi:dipeptidyl aminopeptidase/acylaminoacyl peptidase